MAQPTEEQLLILNCLLYFPLFSELEKYRYEESYSIYEWAKSVDIDSITGEHAGIGKKEFANIIETILYHQEVYDAMYIKDIDNSQFANKTGDERVTNATISYGEDIIVVYKGTGGDYEWRDNGEGGYSIITDTDQQIQALQYFDWAVSAFHHSTGNVYVSGHSKGGNKAQYVTILRGDQITTTYSFDGQGFGLAFLEKYAQEIEKYKGNIISICNEADYVNILMQSIAGEVRYIKSNSTLKMQEIGAFDILMMVFAPKTYQVYTLGQAKLKQFLNCHSPYTMFTLTNGRLVIDKEVKQHKGVEELQEFLQYCQWYMPEDDWRFLCYSIMSFMITDEVSGYQDYSAMPEGFYGRMKNMFNMYLLKAKALDIVGLAQGTPRGFSMIVRDFSIDTKHDILQIVSNVEAEPFWDVTKWAIWSHIGDYLGLLDLPADGEGLYSYYRAVIDKDAIGKAEIERIFNEVYAEEATFTQTMKNVSQIVRDISQKLQNTHQSIIL